MEDPGGFMRVSRWLAHTVDRLPKETAGLPILHPEATSFPAKSWGPNPLPLRGTAARTQPLRFARAHATVGPKAEMSFANALIDADPPGLHAGDRI